MSLHLELVEAEQRRLGRDAVGERRDRVVGVRIGAPEGVETRMNVLHEAVEVDALLAAHVGGGEEQVHQHGLAAADLAHDVEAVRLAPASARGAAGGRTGRCRWPGAAAGRSRAACAHSVWSRSATSSCDASGASSPAATIARKAGSGPRCAGVSAPGWSIPARR